MNNLGLIFILTLTIIVLKVYWISTEIKLFKSRLNLEMLKTNLIEAGILAAQIIQTIYFPLPGTPFTYFISAGGVVVFGIGVILALWARSSMNSVWGIPAENSENQNKLITSGPFQFSRNPIYVGFLLIYFGFAIAINSWLLVLRIPLLIYFYKSAKEEEKLLEKKFGSKYLQYKSQVPRFF